MTEVYVVRNQHGHYWGRAKVWVDGLEPRTVLHLRHEDEALNTLFELSSRDLNLRGRVLAVALSERGEPVVEPSGVPVPQDDGEGADTAALPGEGGA